MEAPFQKFGEWFALAQKSAEQEPTAMCLATVDADNRPSARMVLLKAFDERGFVFYTNETSRKGQQLQHNQDLALCFFWASLDKQIRIEGQVERATDEEADAYFATRARESQLGAWASKQSTLLKNCQELEQRFAKYENRFGDGKIPRPEFWVGYRVRPRMMEFWSEGAHRLHKREKFYKKDGMWKRVLLFP